MLAQNFKTAADLGIKDVELDALIKVLGMLERGEIDESHFNMNDIWCNSVGCIWGWARHVSHQTAFNRRLFATETGTDHGALARLFANFGESELMRRVRRMAQPHHAALAIRSYLTTGEANWAEALAPSHSHDLCGDSD